MVQGLIIGALGSKIKGDDGKLFNFGNKGQQAAPENNEGGGLFIIGAGLVLLVIIIYLKNRN